MRKAAFGIVTATVLMGSGEAAGQTPAYADFLMPVEKEVALARSAAPAHITAEADLYLLGQEGYERITAGTNGFACMVERNYGVEPRVVAPICYNPGAVADVLPVRLYQAELASAGASAPEIQAAVAEEFARGRFKAPQSFAMAYMMSEGQWLGAQAEQAFPHVMLFAPYATNAEVGGNPRGKALANVLEAPGSPQAIVTVGSGTFIPVLAPPQADRQSVTEVERGNLVRLADDNIRRYREVMGSLTPEEMVTRAEPDGWSPAELIEHIAAAEIGMVRALMAALEAPRTGEPFRTGHLDERMRYRLTDRGKRVKTLPSMVPNGRYGDAAAAMATLEQARSDFRKLALTVPVEARDLEFPHPTFPDGNVDGVQWLLIASGHADRHFEQLLEIVEGLRGT